MSERAHTGLGNSVLAERLRQQRPHVQQRHHVRHRRVMDDIVAPRRVQPVVPKTVSAPVQTPIVPKAVPTAVKHIDIITPAPFVAIGRQPQRSKVLQRSAIAKVQTSAKQAVPQSEQQVAGTAWFRRLSRQQLALYGMAVTVFVIGVTVSLITLQTNNTTKAQVAALAVTASEGSGAAAPDAPPSEEKPSATSYNSYTVAPLQPKYIGIAQLGLNARIRPMGINTKGEVQAPANIFDAGWYDASAKPGDSGGNGAMLIDGHVHGPTTPGIFNGLKKLKAGDEIKIVRGDNAQFTYKVVALVEYDVANFDMAAALTSAQPGVPGLNLVTCSGPYDKATGEYSKRTVVFAVQQS